MVNGMTMSSAQCNFIGVVAGNSYDFWADRSSYQGGIFETSSGNVHVQVDNVTIGNPCTVGVTITGIDRDMIFHNGTYMIINSAVTDLSNLSLIISKNVMNKSFHYKVGNDQNVYDLQVTWGQDGMLNSYAFDENYSAGEIRIGFSFEMRRIGGITPCFEPALMAVAFSVGIVIVIVRKKNLS